MALTTIQAVYDEARSALEAGKDERAIGLSEHVLESFPNFLEAYRILGESHLNRQELDQAVQAFQRVLRSDPENIPVHVGLGVTYERQGNLAAAIREFEQAFEIKPDLSELRTQLLRLYNEAWGKEHAHVRLQKVGLARMYMRGRNYAKAIQEFQDVLNQQPERLDVKVALAEALWRNGEEQEAVELSHEILADHPDVLKANLIAGYHALAHGNPKGRDLWHTAQNLDPSQGVAYTLFDGVLPQVDSIDTKIETFSEEAWRAAKVEKQRREQAEREQAERDRVETEQRAQRERAAAEQAERERVEAEHRQAVAEPALAGGGSWLDTLESPPSSNQLAADDDDFLQRLLFGDASDAPAPSSTLPTEPVVEQDFNFDDLGLDVAPFTLEDIEDKHPTQPANIVVPEPTQSSVVVTPEPVIAEPENPFDSINLDESFDETDLGLTADETDLNLDLDLPDDLTPFSFGDWDESGIEDVPGIGLDSGKLPDQLEPFSLENFDDVQTDVATSPDDTPTLPTNLPPFSLDELSLDSIESNQQNAQPAADLPLPTDEERETTGFSWQQPRSRSSGILTNIKRHERTSIYDDANIFQRMVNKKQTENLEPLDQPSFDPSELDEEAMSFFSHDDVDLRNFDEDDLITSTPTNEPVVGFDLNELGSTDTTSTSDEPNLDPFSLSDLGLSEDEIAEFGLQDTATSTAPSTSGVVADDEPSMEPFSLADLGLSEDEIAEFGLQDTATSTAPSTSGVVTDDEPSMEPFSLADLGLSEDEIAEFGLQDTATSTAPSTSGVVADDEPSMEPFSLADLGLTEDEISEFNLQETSTSGVVASDEPSMEPFSLTDLGLSDAEIAEFGGDLQPFSLDDFGSDDVSAEVEPFTREVSDDQTPFSFEDLGLSDEEIAAINRVESTPSYDDVYNHLFEIGSQQGFVDLTDIIARYDDPEAHAEEIDQVAMRLHEGGIQIRDGDEVIDMDSLGEEQADYDAEQPALETFDLADLGVDLDERGTAPLEAEPDLTPFSLSDLGLTDDEIAELNRAEDQTGSPATTSDEPDMTPFSLSDLGLTDEEIAMLDHDGSGAVTADDFAGITPATQEAPTSDEPDLTPFSLADLGLSDEEIAEFNLQDTPSQAAPTSDEPDMTPFSLADLGLTDEEIAMLDQDGSGEVTADDFAGMTPATQEAPTSDEPDMTPFSLADLGLTDDEIAQINQGDDQAVQTPTSDEPDMTPFSLADLGLSDDEIAEFNLQDTPSQAAPTSDEPDMTPFSLADLGLTDEEIAMLDQDGSGEVTADDFAGITPATQEAPTSDEPDMTPFSLADLGLTEDEVSEFGLQETASEPTTSDEPELKPFSLEELGLSPDEIASLGIDDDRNLNISDEELASIDFALPTPEIDQSLLEVQEPEATPFSLDRWDLSADELAALEPEQPDQAVTSDEPDMTPFSLAELGLSEDEIRALEEPTPEPQVSEVTPPHEPEVPAERPRERLYDVSPRPEPRERLYNVSPRPEPRAEPEVAPQPVAPAQREPAHTASHSGDMPVLRPSVMSDIPELAEFQQQLAADPSNHGLRLALARMTGQIDSVDHALVEYKNLIKTGELLEPVMEDLQDLIDSNDDPALLHRIHRVLGDVYSKQGRWREAMAEYSWVKK